MSLLKFLFLVIWLLAVIGGVESGYGARISEQADAEDGDPKLAQKGTRHTLIGVACLCGSVLVTMVWTLVAP